MFLKCLGCGYLRSSLRRTQSPGGALVLPEGPAVAGAVFGGGGAGQRSRCVNLAVVSDACRETFSRCRQANCECRAIRVPQFSRGSMWVGGGGVNVFLCGWLAPVSRASRNTLDCAARVLTGTAVPQGQLRRQLDVLSGVPTPAGGSGVWQCQMRQPKVHRLQGQAPEQRYWGYGFSWSSWRSGLQFAKVVLVFGFRGPADAQGAEEKKRVMPNDPRKGQT